VQLHWCIKIKNWLFCHFICCVNLFFKSIIIWLAKDHVTTPKHALSKLKLRFTSPSINGLPHRWTSHESRVWVRQGIVNRSTVLHHKNCSTMKLPDMDGRVPKHMTKQLHMMSSMPWRDNWMQVSNSEWHHIPCHYITFIMSSYFLYLHDISWTLQYINNVMCIL